MRKIIILLMLCLGGCFPSTKKKIKPLILVTIPPYADLTKQITGDFAEIKIFVPPGANPHIYEPTPRQVKEFAEASLWVRYGDPIELKILPFLRQHHVKDIDLSDGVTLITSGPTCSHHKESQDHHFWLDPLIAKEQARKIADALIKNWPDHRTEFETNYAKLAHRLITLDLEISSHLRSLKGAYLLLSHPALGYYCHKYSLHQLSIESEGKDPLPQQIAHLMQEAKAKQIKVVLIEPQYSTKGATLIADKLHIPTATIDPYAFDYFQMLYQITDTITDYYDH